jgi:hypothetical protein
VFSAPVALGGESIGEAASGEPQGTGGPGGPGRCGGGPDGLMGGYLADYQDDFDAAVASALGMSVEDYQAALAEGKRPGQIAQEQGLDRDAWQTIWLDAHKTVLDQAVADGKLTQDQADALYERIEQGGPGKGGPGGPGGGPGMPGGGQGGNP